MDLDTAIAELENGAPATAPEAPEPTPEPAQELATAPITADDVAGSKAKTPSAPDTTILRDRLSALAAKPQEPTVDPREELEQMQQYMMAMAANKVADPIAFLQQHTGLTPEQLVQKQSAPESLAQKALQEAQAAREEARRYQEELNQREHQRALDEVRASITTFVQSRQDAFPIVNSSESQGLVFEAMYESQQSGNPLSEVEAAEHVEKHLRDFVEKHAPLLGFTKADSQAPETSKVVDSKTLTPQIAGTSSIKSWDEMSFEEREREALKMF